MVMYYKAILFFLFVVYLSYFTKEKLIHIIKKP